MLCAISTLLGLYLKLKNKNGNKNIVTNVYNQNIKVKNNLQIKHKTKIAISLNKTTIKRLTPMQNTQLDPLIQWVDLFFSLQKTDQSFNKEHTEEKIKAYRQHLKNYKSSFLQTMQMHSERYNYQYSIC